MMILALEFSASERSVALVFQRDQEDAGRMLAEATDRGDRTTGALQLIDQVLNDADVERSTVDCLAVGLGPGSYTGIRSAIALAQGWQLAREVKLIGISTVDCLAKQAQSRRWFGTIRFVVDAQREEFYLATYDIGRESVREIEPLRLATALEIRKLGAKRRDELIDAHAGLIEKAPEMIAGPEADRWFPDGMVIVPSAVQLGLETCRRTDFVPGERLEPIYLRETQFVKAPPPRILPDN